jgi:hypothetical protein
MQINKKETTGENPWKNSDLLVKARVSRPDIQLLVKYVEGLGHLGVVTTLDRYQGEVLIQTTKDCWPELQKNMEKLPIVITFME